MPSVTDGFRECRDRVRALGYRVEEVPGWESRGKGRVYPDVGLNHHDAIRGPSPVAGLRLCTYGREGLRNALCNTYGERGPGAGIWLVAAGVAWHAGTGGWEGVSGNSRALGRENANDGVGEPWHPDALEVQRVWDAVQSEVFGIPPSMYCEHREWAPSRKPDRRGIAGPTWRRQIASVSLRPREPERKRVPDMVMFWHTNFVSITDGFSKLPYGLDPDQIDAYKAAGVPLVGEPGKEHPFWRRPDRFA